MILHGRFPMTKSMSMLYRETFLMASVLVLKTFLEVFGISLSIAVSLLDILSFLALLPFSGVTLMEPLTVSMSIHSSWEASPHLTPVSK